MRKGFAVSHAAVLAVVVTLSASPLFAQPRPRPQRDEAFKMIDAYVVSNMQESLQLTDEQFTRMLPLVRRLQGDRRAFAQRRMQALGELRRLLGGGSATEARVAELLKEIKSAESDEVNTLPKHREAIDAVLSPVQQAKFRIMELEVEHKIRELMSQLRADRRARRPGAPGPRPE